MRPRDRQPPSRLVVDPVACDAIGLCSHLAPRVIELDRWGYPVVPGDALTRAGLRSAGRAVRGCPRRAMAVVPVQDEGRHGRS